MGFIAGFFSKEITACTEMACLCQESGQFPCNSCFSTDEVFIAGVLNIVKECPAQEIIICKDQRQVDTRIEVEECNYNFILG